MLLTGYQRRMTDSFKCRRITLKFNYPNAAQSHDLKTENDNYRTNWFEGVFHVVNAAYEDRKA